MELADVEVMKPPTAARIDPAIEVTAAQLLKVENMPQVSDDDGDSHVPSITFVDDSKVEIVAVGEVPDQEDEYDTDSGNDMNDDNTHQVWSRHSRSFSPWLLEFARSGVRIYITLWKESKFWNKDCKSKSVIETEENLHCRA